MIALYSGTPGSGKSFHTCDDIYCALRWQGKNVIANFPINLKSIKKQKGIFLYKTNDELNVRFLVDFARQYHKPYKENQTLLVIDEAGIKFNARRWADKDRLDWLNFFSQHRKLGYNIILVAQSDLMLDKQIRSFIEVNHVHRRMASNGKVGALLSPLFTFCDIRYFYGLNLRLGVDFLRYRKNIGNLYDTFMMFE